MPYEYEDEALANFAGDEDEFSEDEDIEEPNDDDSDDSEGI